MEDKTEKTEDFENSRSNRNNNLTSSMLSLRDITIQHKCVLCHKLAKKKCARCGDYYCSILCRDMDWQRHRYICFNKPYLLDEEDENNDAIDHTNNESVMIELKENIKPSCDLEVKEIELSDVKAVVEKIDNYQDTNETLHKPKIEENVIYKPDFKHSSHSSSFKDGKISEEIEISESVKAVFEKIDNYQDTDEIIHEPKLEENVICTLLPPSSSSEDGSESKSTKPISSNNNERILKEKHSNEIKNDKLKQQQMMTSDNQNSEKNRNRHEILIEKRRNSNIKIVLPANENDVVISSINAPNMIYVRLYNDEINREYKRIISLVRKCGKHAKPLQKIPNESDVVITDYQGKYYRVLVLHALDEDHITVLYIDFGDKEIKKLSQLKLLPMELSELKSYVVPIEMENVPKYSDDISELIVKDYLNNILFNDNNELQIFQILYDQNASKGKKQIVAKLKNQKTNEIVNDKIIEFAESIKKTKNDVKNEESCNVEGKEKENISGAKIVDMKKEPVIADFVTIKDIERILIPDAENIELFVLDNSMLEKRLLSCITEENYIVLLDFCNEINKYVETIPDEPYKPKVSEICLAQYIDDGNWYRAECISLDCDEKDSCTVLFIDFGNTSITNLNKIRKCPKKFTQACVTSNCIVAGLPKCLEMSTVNRLQEFLPNNEKILVTRINKITTKNGGERNIIVIPEIFQLFAEDLIE